MERKIDELGRLVIPMEFRRALGWTTGTRVKMELQGGCINLTKNESRCSFCGSVHELKDVKGVRVCDRCIIDIKYGEFQDVLMMQYEMKARTAYQKFKLIMELFEHYAQLLVDQCWLEVVVFEIPRINLKRQDQEDLARIISSKVPVEVQFLRTTCRDIQVTVKRIKGEY